MRRAGARVGARRGAPGGGRRTRRARAAALLRPHGFRLGNGRRLRIRPILASDAEGLRAAFYRLSDESRYQRFMAPVKEISPDMVQRATHPDPAREVALVIIDGAGGSEIIVGGARYAGDADGACCEFAVTVVDDWQGLGLGTRVMRKLMRVARAMRYRTIYGYVLASNAPMLALARRLGFRIEDSSDGPRVKLVIRELKNFR
jgi:RimJ/RimL family protein N-acetyltransferase